MQYRSVTVLAPAKLNLSLDVVGTLPNCPLISTTASCGPSIKDRR